jgi:hypothetical protein
MATDVYVGLLWHERRGKPQESAKSAKKKFLFALFRGKTGSAGV